MTTAPAPLDDPRYDPVHKPFRGGVPDVVARWGPRSQRRWFRRFARQLKWQSADYWSRFHVSSVHHTGHCCLSCADDVGVWGNGICCCYGYQAQAATPASGASS